MSFCFSISVICASLTAFMSMNLFHAYNAWSWHYAFLFGSILSATDPVAVVALLRDVGKFFLECFLLWKLLISPFSS